MKILIIGGTRFIGKAAAELAVSQGHEVVLFNRGKTAPHCQIPTIYGDIENLSSHASTLRDLRPDVIIHANAYTEKHGHDVVNTFAGTDSRLIVLSSQDCYEAFFQVNRGKDVAELPIAEDGLLCQTQHYWRDIPGSKSYPDYDKNLLTTAVMDAHASGKIRAGVLRLPMVFGPGDFQFHHRHGSFIRRIFDEKNFLVLGSVEQASLFTFGYIDNVAAAILHAAHSAEIAGHIYNIGESKSRSIRRWAELYAEAANIQFDVHVLPDALLRKSATTINNPPRFILFDTSAFSRDTGFIEPVPLSRQILKTLAWGLKNAESLGPMPNYQVEEMMVERYRKFIHENVS